MFGWSVDMQLRKKNSRRQEGKRGEGKALTHSEEDDDNQADKARRKCFRFGDIWKVWNVPLFCIKYFCQRHLGHDIILEFSPNVTHTQADTFMGLDYLGERRGKEGFWRRPLRIQNFMAVEEREGDGRARASLPGLV